MLHRGDHHRPTTELHHHGEADTAVDAWTGMTRRETAETTADRPPHNRSDAENDHTPTRDLLRALRPDVVVLLLEVLHVGEEEVQATAPTAVTAEVVPPRKVAVRVVHATIVGDSPSESLAMRASAIEALSLESHKNVMCPGERSCSTRE